MERLTIEDKLSGDNEATPATLFFPLIGATPYTDWLADIVQRDSKGFILTGYDVDIEHWPLQRRPMHFETSMPGIFAIGDVRLSSTKRIASAVGEGAGAVQNVHQYLDEQTQSPQARRAALLQAFLQHEVGYYSVTLRAVR